MIHKLLPSLSIYNPYVKKPFLMNKNEFAFFKVLEQIIGDSYYIVPQVVLSNIIEVKAEGFWKKPYRTKIDKKTVDFVLFGKAGYTPHLVIELDGNSHLETKTIRRDEFVEDILHRSGIRIIRVKNANSYNLEEITELVK